MDCFNYPLDSKMLLRKKIRIKKELLDSNMSFIEKRIAVLGGSTTNEIVDQLELFLLNYGIKPTFYQSEYAQYWQDAMFGNEELDSFKPDIVYVHTNWRNITEFPTTSSTKEEADVMLKNTYNHFAVMWDKLSERFQCPIIQDNFDRPAWRLLGNSDVSDYRGRTNFISRLNQKLYQYAAFGCSVKLEKGIATLADILGHSCINTTRIYIISTGYEHLKRMENMRLVV